MTPAETARVLAAIAGRDQRTVGEADVMAWHEDVGDLDYRDCLAAVSEHFRNSEARCMPVHIRRIATALRRDRAKREQTEHALAAADRDDVLPPGELHRRIDDAIRAARAARNTRQVTEPDPATPARRWVPDHLFVSGPTEDSCAQVENRLPLRGAEPVRRCGRPEAEHSDADRSGAHGPTDPDDDNRIRR